MNQARVIVDAGRFPRLSRKSLRYNRWSRFGGIRVILSFFVAFAIFGCDSKDPDKNAKNSTDHSGEVSSGETLGVVILRDVAESVGLNFHHKSGHEELHYLPEIMGGGGALLDYDNDGDLDLYCVQSGSLVSETSSGNQLFQNDGSGRFIDVSSGSGADDTGYGMGVAAGDYDNDGDTDLYVTNVGPNVLLRNEGDGKFTEIDSAVTAHSGWSTSAAFFDADADGDLDLFVCNYIVWSQAADVRCKSLTGVPDYCNPISYDAPQADGFYRNRGDGTFEDATEECGFLSAFGNGLGVVCGDFNGDAKPDVFVANDGTDNQLWIQQADGTFSNEAFTAGCAMDKNGKLKAGMGTCAADIDDDNDLDLLVVNLQAQSDSFFRNQGGYFSDHTPTVGLGSATRSATRFGTGWFDFDNNGTLDLFQANGRVTLPQKSDDPNDPFAEPNVLLAGSAGKFRMLPGAVSSDIRTSRAALFGDMNNDGGIDIVVINRDARAALLFNEAKRGNWLLLNVLNSQGRPAVGAIVRCRIGDRTLRRDVNPHYGYLASNDPRVHFGLGDTEEVTTVDVTWPSGMRESFGPISVNSVSEIREGTGQRL